MISLVFGRDYSSPDAPAQAVAEEGAALAGLGQELIGSDRPLVTVSGTPWVPERASTEADSLPTDGPVGGQSCSVMALLGLALRGVRATAVRTPRMVQNEGKGGFAGLLTDPARRTGVSGYPGDGTSVGPPCTPSTKPSCSGWPSNRPPAGTAWLAVKGQRRRGAGYRNRHRRATGAGGRGGAAGKLRPVQRHLRDGPAGV